MEWWRLVAAVAAILPAAAIFAASMLRSRATWNNEALWSGLLLGGFAAVGLSVGWALLFTFVDANRLTAALGLNEAFSIALFKSGIEAALPEEALKYFIVVVIMFRHVDLQRVQDRLPLCVAVSLGFAALENLFFILGDESRWQTVAMLRTVLATPGHALDGMLMGSALCRAGASRREVRRLWTVLAYLLPAGAHFMYDAPLLFGWKEDLINIGIPVFSAVIAILGVGVILFMSSSLAAAAKVDEASALASVESPNLKAMGILAGLIFLVGIGAVLLAFWSLDLALVKVWITLPLCILPTILAGDLVLSTLRARKRGALL